MIILMIRIMYVNREQSPLNLTALLLNYTIIGYEFINYKA